MKSAPGHSTKAFLSEDEIKVLVDYHGEQTAQASKVRDGDGFLYHRFRLLDMLRLLPGERAAS